ncbi:MAG: UDP-N-acetylglucosamine 2-epimerase (non-hydrolyzing), partial [Acidobacteria bacterium]|nr:UDP-N-acetylglucosamine 2-epimerase (non-hydrolyzing) [Acidobacteriota bacterium]
MKILFILGTRPEAIKLAPLIKVFKNDPHFEARVCVTGQHRQLLDPMLGFFGITPDYDLRVMKEDQSLYSVTAKI